MHSETHDKGEARLSAGDYQRLLGETAYLLLQDVDAHTMAQTVYSKLSEYLPLDAFVHYLVSADGTHLQLASAGGNTDIRAGLGPTLEFGQAVCGTVAQTCEWMHVTGVQARTDEMTGLIRSLGLRAYTCQPLFARGKLMGTFSFGSTQRDAFLKDELDLFQMVAEQVALATDRRLQNERLFTLEREAASGRMSATLAHEINNPLESLINLLYLLREECGSDNARQLLDTAEAEVMRLGETTQRTLELARGNRHPAKTFFVSEFLKEIAHSIKLPHGVPLDLHLEGDPYVKVVPGELKQSVYNLLLNAAQFTPPGGRVMLACQRNGAFAEILVIDEGPGISEAARPHIFQPYYTTREVGGTGLGLWASRGLMQRYGGDITFAANPEGLPGTTFTLTLPQFHD